MLRYAQLMNTDARVIAEQYYRVGGRDLSVDMAALTSNPRGMVVWLPRLVVLMKPVDSNRPERWERLSENPVGADGWYVHLLTGELAFAGRLMVQVPRLDWACFQRGRRSSAPHRLSWSGLISRLASAAPAYHH